MPEAFINEAGNFVTEAFEKYATPLIGGRLPVTLEPDPIKEDVRLEPIPVSPPTDEPKPPLHSPRKWGDNGEAL